MATEGTPADEPAPAAEGTGEWAEPLQDEKGAAAAAGEEVREARIDPAEIRREKEPAEAAGGTRDFQHQHFAAGLQHATVLAEGRHEVADVTQRKAHREHVE